MKIPSKTENWGRGGWKKRLHLETTPTLFCWKAPEMFCGLSGLLFITTAVSRWKVNFYFLSELFLWHSPTVCGAFYLTCWIGSWRGVCLAAVSWHAGCIDCSPGCVHVGLFLELADVFLVSDSLVTEPVWYLSKWREQSYDTQGCAIRAQHDCCALFLAFNIHPLNARKNIIRNKNPDWS